MQIVTWRKSVRYRYLKHSSLQTSFRSLCKQGGICQIVPRSQIYRCVLITNQTNRVAWQNRIISFFEVTLSQLPRTTENHLRTKEHKVAPIINYWGGNSLEKLWRIYVFSELYKATIFFYKHTGKFGWSSIYLRFSQFEPEIMLDGMLKFKTHFTVWYCVWYEHCNGLF